MVSSTLSLELRQLVEEQHAVRRQRDFARCRIDVAAKQSGVAGRWQGCLFVVLGWSK